MPVSSSFLQLLTPNRKLPTTQLPSSSSPALTLDVPGYGAVLMNLPDVTRVSPRADQILYGDLNISLEHPKRCRAIRAGLVTTVSLDLGSARRGEKDVLFERKAEIRAGSAEGLHFEGTQK